MSQLAKHALGWTELGLVPDTAVRAGIRRLLARRLTEIHAYDGERAAADLNEFVAGMRGAVVAPVPAIANEQHYEVPAQFFAAALGGHRKYSCCYWSDDTATLDDAEASALRVTCERAGIENGMTVLDLGCGWGSLSLWIASRYPNCSVTAVSNSRNQARHIRSEAHRRGLSNVQVLTCDMNVFAPTETYDRVVSVEMFEHMRNYELLFERINAWLNPGGHFFMHIFCHRLCAYAFEDKGPADWMSRHFFSGGIMPSVDLPLRFQRHLALRQRWTWDGRHYQKTANAWLANMDGRKDQILPILRATYGTQHAAQWQQRWRMFFMACAELFGYADGQEWFVGHYLFRRGDRA